jgi:hypothetical protein
VAAGAGASGVASLNALDGTVTSNLAIVTVAGEWISTLASNPTHIVMDISGVPGAVDAVSAGRFPIAKRPSGMTGFLTLNISYFII